MLNLKKAFYRWKEVIAITIVLRLALFLYSLFFIESNRDFFTLWAKGWDSNWYLDIAQNWYVSFGEESILIVFYPFYPLLVKLASFFIPNFHLAAILLSTFFSFVAAIALFELALLDFNKRVAILSVWFMNIFPTAYFLQSGYTESTFLALSLLTIYFFRKKTFSISSIFGVFSSLTKFNGLFLIPTLFLENGKNFKRLQYAFSPIIGFLTYLMINYKIFNDPFYFTKPLSSNWYKELDWPWNGLRYLVSSLTPIDSPDFYINFSEVVAVLLILFFGIYTFLKIRRSYGVYILINLLLITSTNYILSTPRYALILFPIFIALGSIKNIKVIIFISIIFIILLLHFTNLYISGKWAF